MKTIDLSDFFLNKGLYDPIEFDRGNLKVLVNTLLYFDYTEDIKFSPSLNCYCVKCDKEVTFKSKNSHDSLESIIYSYRQVYNENSNFPEQLKINNFINELLGYGMFFREFQCPHVLDDSHNIIFILKLVDNKIIKIGQNPTFNDLNKSDLKKIRKYKPEIYSELNKALGLFSHGIGVGSYVYLRRILEKHIVNPKFQIKLNNEPNKNLFNNYHFDDKVKFLGNDISEFLSFNSKLYGFISKGIHELEEDECINYFPLIYQTIIMILEEEIDIEERLKKKSQIQKELNKL